MSLETEISYQKQEEKMAGSPLCHFELMVPDTDKTKAFYTQVFDWSFEAWEGGEGYEMIQAGAEPGGGLMKMPEMAPHPALNVYFLVDDVDSTMEKAKAAGANVIVPKMEIPGIGWHGMFMDPDGIPVGVFQPTSSE